MTAISLKTVDQLHFQPKNSFFFDEKLHLISKKIKQISYSTCEHAWSYGGKICLLTRHFLNTLVNNAHVVSLAGKNFTKTVVHITTRLKVFSIVSVFFNIFDLKNVVQKIFKDIMSRNFEGISLNTLSFTIISADILDSIATFINATLTLASTTPIAILAAAGMPLTYLISSCGTISRTVQIAKSYHLYQEINKEIHSKKYQNKDTLKTFLEKTLKISPELKDLLAIPSDQITKKQLEEIKRLKEQNKTALLRAVPNEAVKDLEKLLTLLESTHEEIFSDQMQNDIIKTLYRVQKHLIKKIKVNALGILANLFTLTALTLFAATSLASFPFALVTIGFAIRLVALFYQDQKLKLKM